MEQEYAAVAELNRLLCKNQKHEIKAQNKFSEKNSPTFYLFIFATLIFTPANMSAFILRTRCTKI